MSWLLCLLMALSVHSAHAEQGDPSARPKVRRSLRLTKESQSQRVKTLTQDGDKEAFLSTLDQLVTLLLVDVRDELSAGRSPLTIKGIGVRAPLAPNVADWLDARVIASLHQSGIPTVMCVPCRAQVTTLTEEAWRLKQGLSAPQDIQSAATSSGARSLLELLVGWNAPRNRAQLRARLYSADGAVLWARDYQNREDGSPQRVARSADMEGDSSVRYQALAEMYEPRASDNVISVVLGGGFAPSSSGASSAGVTELGVGWGERFGEALSYRYALTINFGTNPTKGEFNTHLGGELMARLGDPPKAKKGSMDTRGFWLGGGASLNYVIIRQGVGTFVNADWVSSVGLGGRLKAGYQFAFGDSEPDLAGLYMMFSILFLM